MSAATGGAAVSKIAQAIGEPTRARILLCLMDGHARSSTELAVVAGVSPSTTSVHLDRLKKVQLVKVLVRGKHHFYSLAGPEVASALEGLSVLVGFSPEKFEPTTPSRLRAARTCYDHLAGAFGVSLHDRLETLGWLSIRSERGQPQYGVTPGGERAFGNIGVDIETTRGLRRRFACACLDWSERRPHLGGSLGAALLKVALGRKWVIQDLDSRALTLTGRGRRDVQALFGLRV